MRSLLPPVWVLLLFAALLHADAGTGNSSIPYDYSASIECLAAPHKAQYGGGMISNPEFDDGLSGWTTFAGGIVEHRTSSDGGNRFAVTRGRSRSYDSLARKLNLEEDKLYTFSAWLQVNRGSTAQITAIFKTSSGYVIAGTAWAEAGCWSMLKGGLTVNTSGPAELYFETEDATLEVWVDSVSLQPFTEEQWRGHQDESIQKVRKRRVEFKVVDAQGAAAPGAQVVVNQQRRAFPFGAAIAPQILASAAYQSWFTSRFTVTTFENEMKWYSTERSPGREDYSVPDAMLAFAQRNRVAVRAHNVLWDDGRFLPGWAAALPPAQLQAAVDRRMNSIMTRYRGRVVGWDVINENMHFAFLESRLGANASAAVYRRARQLDPAAPMFLNEYNTIEDPADRAASPGNYLRKLRQVGATAVGLEGHFHTPNIPYMRSAIDILAQARLPIWITEVDVSPSPNQAQFLEQVLREAHAHPAVGGIVIWAAHSPNGCFTMCLTDGAFGNLPTGAVVDRLIGEWGTHRLVAGGGGVFRAELFLGEYEVTVTQPSTNTTSTQLLKVEAGSSPEETLHIQLQA